MLNVFSVLALALLQRIRTIFVQIRILSYRNFAPNFSKNKFFTQNFPMF
jgi:hypothetical protein